MAMAKYLLICAYPLNCKGIFGLWVVIVSGLLIVRKVKPMAWSWSMSCSFFNMG